MNYVKATVLFIYAPPSVFKVKFNQLVLVSRGYFVKFPDTIDLKPIPVNSREAARSALHFQKKVTQAGGIKVAAQEIVDRIYATDAGDPSGERKRLLLLYQQSYSRSELEQLAINTFASLGIPD